MDEGNQRLRYMSALQAREKFREQFVRDPELKEIYYRWLKGVYDGTKQTYTAEYRGLIARKRPT